RSGPSAGGSPSPGRRVRSRWRSGGGAGRRAASGRAQRGSGRAIVTGRIGEGVSGARAWAVVPANDVVTGGVEDESTRASWVSDLTGHLAPGASSRRRTGRSCRWRDEWAIAARGRSADARGP